MNSDKKRILVVDDEETLCEVLSFNLENEGYEVTTALSAEEALALDLTSFDLILLDIMLGAISGTQIAEIMKRRKECAGAGPYGASPFRTDSGAGCAEMRQSLRFFAQQDMHNRRQGSKDAEKGI